MLLGFKTELKLNNQQRTAFAKHCGVARHAWNWGLGLTKQILDHNKANSDSKIKFPSAIDLHKWLVALVKSENEWYYECSKSTPQQALMALREAWKRCFNKTAGVPKFKKKGKRDSFTLEGTVKILGNNKIQVPVIGVLKTYERLPQVKPKSVTISRQSDRWFISFRFEVETQSSNNTSVVGVDVGVKNLAILSTGEVIEGAKSYRKHEQKLAQFQFLNRHKIKGSKNWRKAQTKIARLHRKIANIRRDTLHKLTTLLAKNHGVVVIEDLNVFGMLANHKLAKAIADMSFFEFRRQLTYKCELYGSKLVVVNRWFPSSKTCSNCGAKKETLTLDERVFECFKCGFVIDRDLNAAINLSKAVS
ncbi:IS200/IS605 family element transposase accessory protein TnpB [Hassallia byssoidea VB512170]|uniref:IS200/IS605 family element transposase accessory protein TnpB n=1 Tax=Hassallia byssoidea VB512170 TaxID=1304833 RepID=A0A846HI89_9CYAN|nr:RNA-guided endonuclease TnpB family protein [Hassalia byssoidea]NEU76549.1 IS200/IS605 family element transposase accessory protein TnpB [Hassalia byssoidea VB512170]